MLASDRALEPEKDQDKGHLTPFSVLKLEIMHVYGPPKGTRAGAQPSKIANHTRREYPRSPDCESTASVRSSLLPLQAAQARHRLSAEVSPPSTRGMMWSMWQRCPLSHSET